ncbi:hypothetical protein [Desulfococcus sp.]|uniref:hypothetical protein n=1 Tax=Desulfococcus sp. TaxID=2025834 RepID=UPI00359480E1
MERGSLASAGRRRQQDEPVVKRHSLAGSADNAIGEWIRHYRSSPEPGSFSRISNSGGQFFGGLVSPRISSIKYASVISRKDVGESHIPRPATPMPHKSLHPCSRNIYSKLDRLSIGTSLRIRMRQQKRDSHPSPTKKGASRKG